MFQKSQKLLLLILFTFSLNTAQAGMLNDNIGRLSQFVMSWFQTHREKLPILGLGAVVGITTLWLFSQKKSSCLLSGTIDPKIIENTSRTKINVLSQSSNAQCGYHSLKNALLFSEASTQRWINEINDTRFSDSKHYTDLFNQWRNQIINYRKTQQLKNYLQNQLKGHLVKTNEPLSSCEGIAQVVHDEYKKLLETIGYNLAILIFEQLQHPNNLFIINQKMLIPQLESCVNNIINITINKVLDKNLNTTNDQSIKLIENYIKNIKKHLPQLDSLNLKIVQEDIERLFGQSEFKNNPDEWLDGDEIKELLKLNPNQHLQDHITIIDDIQQFELTNFDISQLWQVSSDCFHIFIIGTMSETGNKRGHWFILATQKINNETRYFTADSLETDRTRDSRVLQIIQHLESISNNNHN